ncbi:MAG: hypothetical protein IKK92_09670 [Prevotella sp.]|nr:hypothetical protein [Prevotella sp.]
MINLSPNDLVKIAKQLVKKGFDKEHSTAATLVTTSTYVDGEREKLVNQAIVLCAEVKL